MNDLGNLANNIVNFHFTSGDSSHPISFVSGWLEANLGQLNGYTFEEFAVTDSGNFDPSLEPIEEAIFTSIYEIDYYDRKIRQTLNGSLSSSGEGDWSMIREGDTVIQKTSKHLISREWKGFRDASKDRLDDLVMKYDMYKAEPLQVAGTDGLLIDYSRGLSITR